MSPIVIGDSDEDFQAAQETEEHYSDFSARTIDVFDQFSAQDI